MAKQIIRKSTKVLPKDVPEPVIETQADLLAAISDGEFSDLGGYTDDLDLDINAPPPWALDS